MAGSRDSSKVSPSNIIEPTWETLPADEQLQFEEHKEQLIQEGKAKFLANFKVDRNNKVVRQWAMDPASLRPTPDNPNVSNTNELQSLKNYVDEQREQMQNIIGDMQHDYRRLVRAFDKSTVANFPSHEVELGENMHNSLATSCHDQLQPLYGMPIDTCPGQPQPPTHIGNKLVDLHMTGPSARERAPSGPAPIGPVFNELSRHAPEPHRTAQNQNYPVEPSAYSNGWSAYNHGRSEHIPGQSAHIAGRSAYPSGRSGAEFFEEDCYLNPQPSQQHLPSHYTMHQHINTKSQAHGSEYFPAPPRRSERNGQSYEPYRANSNVPHNSNQWGEDNMLISSQPHQCLTRGPVV
jgi:hypothetical protein